MQKQLTEVMNFFYLLDIPSVFSDCLKTKLQTVALICTKHFR